MKSYDIISKVGKESKADKESSRVEATFCKMLVDPKKYPLEWIKKTANANLREENIGKGVSIRTSAVSLAVQYNRVDVLKWLVSEIQWSLKECPIINAIEMHQEEVLAALLEIEAERGMEGYCVEACIFAGNLTALIYLTNNKKFPLMLATCSYTNATGDHAPLHENITTLMIKENQFTMLLWLLKNNPNEFKEDLLGKRIKTLPVLYDYFKILSHTDLKVLKDYLKEAFGKLKMFEHPLAIEIRDKLDEILMIHVDAIATSTPSTAKSSAASSLSSSPVKHTFFNPIELCSKLLMLESVSEQEDTLTDSVLLLTKPT